LDAITHAVFNSKSILKGKHVNIHAIFLINIMNKYFEKEYNNEIIHLFDSIHNNDKVYIPNTWCELGQILNTIFSDSV